MKLNEYLKDFLKNGSNVTIIGNYYGENIGDNAILKVMLKDLESEKVSIQIPSKNSEKTKEIFKTGFKNTITTLDLGSGFIDLLTKSFQSDVFVTGGGTIFSRFSGKFVYFLPFYLTLMKIFGKKIIFYSIGYEDTTPKIITLMMRFIFVISDKISVRDLKSLALLRTLTSKNIDLIEDPVKRIGEYITEEDLKVFDFLFKELKIPSSDYIVTAFNYLKNVKIDTSLQNQAVQLVKYLIEKRYKIVLISFAIDDDLLTNFIYNSLTEFEKQSVITINQRIDVFAIIRIFKNANFVIAQRLHSMILSYASGVKYIPISYQLKCEAFMEQIGREEYIKITDFVKLTNYDELLQLAKV
jgi:polysaccharide pyruvyl transferase WcaK-like protein